MKKKLLLSLWVLIGLFFMGIRANAATTYITNEKLLKALLENPYTIDMNGDGKISKKEANDYSWDLFLSNKGLSGSDLTELDYFDNVESVMLDKNNIDDISALNKMAKLQYAAIGLNPFDCTFLRTHDKCSQKIALESKGINVAATQLVIDWDSTFASQTTNKYKVLVTIVKDIKTTVELTDGTIRNIEYHMSDTDISLIRQYVRLFERYVEKLSNYSVDLDVEIYVTQTTQTTLPENGYSESGKEFQLFGSYVPEIAGIIEDYDTSVVVAYSHYDTHSFSGVAGFNTETNRGEVYVPYDGFVYQYLVDQLNFINDAERDTLVKKMSVSSMDEFYNNINDRSLNPGGDVEIAIQYLNDKYIEKEKKNTITDLKKNYVNSANVDTFVHEFIHTLEFYAQNREFNMWEFHDAINLGREFNDIYINRGDQTDYEALYLRGYHNPENDEQTGVPEWVYVNPPTKYFTTTLSAPDAPQVVIDVDEDNETISLSWNEVNDATYYKILRYTSSTGRYDLIDFTQNTSFVDNTISTGKTYYYKIIAVNSSGIQSARSFASNKVSGMVPTKTVEIAPTVKVAKGTGNSLVISWNSVNNATSYTLYRSTSANGTYKVVASNITKTKYTNAGLTYGTTYYYKVKASNEISSKTSSVVSKKLVPGTVTNLKVLVNAASLKLSWDKVTVDGYEIYRSTDNKTFSKITTITKNSTLTYTNTSVNANTTYYYKVRAYKTVNGTKVYGSFSSVVSAKTPPKAPTISVATWNYKTLKVTVNSVSGASKYLIYRSTSKAGTYTKVGELTKAGTYSDTVTPKKTYYYKVKACNSKNYCGSYSSIVSKATVIKAPSNLTKSGKTLSWSSVFGATGYQVYRSTSKNGTYTKIGKVSTTSYKDTTAKSGVTYYYKVRAYIYYEGTTYFGSYASIS